MKKKAQIVQYVVLVLCGIVLLNLVGKQINFRLDLTDDNRYTLSPATESMLNALEEPITVTGYFTDDLPPNLVSVRNEIKDMLIEFAERSDGNLVYKFVDPNSDEEIAQEAQQTGIGPFQVQVRQNDRIENMLAYMGLELKLGEGSDVIPAITSAERLEYTLASSIRKLAVIDKPYVGILQGHGEPGLDELGEVLQGMDISSAVQPVALFDTIPVNERFKTIVIVNPTDTFSPGHLAQLDAFLARGGNMVVCLDRVTADLTQNQFGTPRNIGIENWLSQKGILIKPNFMINKKCGKVQVRRMMGPIPMLMPVDFPYFPLFEDFAEHPITSGLNGVIMQFTAPIVFTGDSSVKYTPLVFTGDASGEIPAPTMFDVNKQWTNADFTAPGLVAGAAIEGQLVPGSPGNKLVVFSNGNFGVNGSGQQQQRLAPDNVNLLVNSAEWLSDNTGLIDLRTRGSSYRPLDDLEEAERTQLKWLNFLMPILLVLFYGIIRSRWRRQQREKRRAANYVQ